MYHLQYEMSEGVARITMDREEKRNAFNSELIAELKEAFNDADKDDSVRVVVLKAKGTAFSAGADLDYLKSLQEKSYEENLADSKLLMDLLLKIYSLSKPVIAQVQGPAIAGGCGLVTVADFAIASEDALFGYSEVRIGFVPALVAVFLVRKIGDARARRLLLGGENFSAAQALTEGIISKLCTADMLEQEVEELAASLRDKTAPSSEAYTKQLLSSIEGADFGAALETAAEINAKARSSADCKKGIAAFLNKEKISWA